MALKARSFGTACGNLIRPSSASILLIYHASVTCAQTNGESSSIGISSPRFVVAAAHRVQINFFHSILNQQFQEKMTKNQCGKRKYY